MHYYQAYGLRIHTALSLPELAKASGREATADITIRPGRLGASPPIPPYQDRYVEMRDDGVYFYWPTVGAFLAREGRTVVYDAAPNVPEDMVRPPLLGAVLGTLLHQRGLYTLQASAVLIDDAVVAFIGWRGAGKSTIAGALHERGHAVVTDDVLALASADDEMCVRPAFPRIKLLPDAASTLEKESSGLVSLGRRIRRRALRTVSLDASALPLRGIYALAEGPETTMKPLSLREAFLQLLSHSYAPRFLGTSGTPPAHFHQSLQLIRTVPICRLERPRDLMELPAVARLVEDTIPHSRPL